MAAVSAAINGGTLYKPYIVKSLNEPETNSVIQETKKTKVRNVIDAKTSKKVRETLESVVTNGTGRTAFIDGYRVGGKTGTAQKVKDGKYMVGNYTVSFMGFMPADDPKIVVYVAVDNAKGITQYGGTIAGPIAKNILTDAIDILHIQKPKGASEKEYNIGEKKYISIPNVVGKSKEEANELLEDFTIVYSGSGSKVTYQSPKEGTRILEGEEVRILLNE